MSKNSRTSDENLSEPDLSMGKSPLEWEVEGDIELLEAGMSPDDIADMAKRSRELLKRYGHYDSDDGDDEGVRADD
jgi:hypothetical protein